MGHHLHKWNDTEQNYYFKTHAFFTGLEAARTDYQRRICDFEMCYRVFFLLILWCSLHHKSLHFISFSVSLLIRMNYDSETVITWEMLAGKGMCLKIFGPRKRNFLIHIDSPYLNPKCIFRLRVERFQRYLTVCKTFVDFFFFKSACNIYWWQTGFVPISLTMSLRNNENWIHIKQKGVNSLGRKL